MNYPSSLRFLNSFPNFEQIALTSLQPWNLKRMQSFLKWFDHPEKSFFSVVIAGTKGKGSTGFFLESILKASGISCGFYSSPHLETPRERIRLGGERISKALWIEGMEQIHTRLSLKRRGGARHWDAGGSVATCPRPGNRKGCPYTYFEIMTLMAALAFKQAGVQVGIFEVGMGGRLDATNAISHPLSVITLIDFDHEAVLGHTLQKIAAEKAAIIEPQSEVVVAPQHAQAMRVIQARAKKQKARIYFPMIHNAKVGLVGDYQQRNAATAQKAAEVLRDQAGFKITQEGIQKGLQQSHWPGRFEGIKRGSRQFLLDAAHNPVSVRALVRNLKRLYPHRPRLLIFGTSKDKNAAVMLQTLAAYFPEVILTRALHPRSYEVGKLLNESCGLFQKTYPFAPIPAALDFAKMKAAPGTLIVVTGSFYVVGEARTKLKGKSKK